MIRRLRTGFPDILVTDLVCHRLLRVGRQREGPANIEKAKLNDFYLSARRDEPEEKDSWHAQLQ